MIKNQRVLAFLFGGLLFQMAQPACAQLEGKIVYPKFYRYHAGDDTTWAQPEFDDSAWEQIPINDSPLDRWRGIGWARFVLEVDSTFWNKPLGLFLQYAGAAEFYLDGKLLYRFGKVGASKEEEEPSVDMLPIPYAISFAAPPNADSIKLRHRVAIRYSNFFSSSYVAPAPLPIFGIKIGDLKQVNVQRDNLRRRMTIHQMLLMGILLAFAMLHLLLFLFYSRPRANLYYAASSAGCAFVVYLWFQIFFITDPVYYIWDFQLIFTVFTLMMLSFIRLAYALIYPERPRVFMLFCLVGFSLTLWFWLKPLGPLIALTWLSVFYFAAFAEMIRALLVARIRKRQMQLEGSWIILLGMIPLALTGAYWSLILLDVVPEPWSFVDFPMPLYAMLILMISMSVFLARNFAQTNKNLEAQLLQVKALSEKTIQQEREKAQLEAENARKTHEFQEARQLQLSMLPKNPPALPHLDIAADIQTATEVGGDYYDFKVHDDGVLTIAVGDATGHGMQAGTMVAATKSLFNALADEPEPAIILQKATKALKEMGYRKMYMALTVAKIQNHHMLVAAAGMPYTLIYRAVGGGVEEIALKAMPLGSFPNFKYEQKKIALEPGDTVFFLSDGLEEMFDPQGEILGAARVKELVAEAGPKPSEQVIAHLKNAGKAWANGRAQEDDVTMVVVRVTQSARLV